VTPRLKPQQPAAPHAVSPADVMPFAFEPRRVGTVNWLGVWTLYQKEVERFLKVAMQAIVAPVVTTLLFLAIFTLAFGARSRMAIDIPFAQFLAPGLIMMAIIQNSFANTASSILVSKIQGNVVDVLMPPLGAGELTFCYAMAGLTRGLVCAVAVFAGMFPFVDFAVHHVWPIVLFAGGAGLLLSLLGIIAGIWADKFDHMSAVTNFVITPLAFLSGTFYSVDRLPETWRLLSHLNPFFYMIDGFRYAFIDHADGVLAIGVGLIVGLNLALWTIAVLLFRRGWRLKA
jgi:ABC-2 type transport system permease protein